MLHVLFAIIIRSHVFVMFCCGSSLGMFLQKLVIQENGAPESFKAFSRSMKGAAHVV